MAGLTNLAEELSLVHVNDLEESIFDNIQNNSFSSSIASIKESDNGLVKDDSNETTPNIKDLNSTGDNINQAQIGVQISNDFSNSLHSNDEQILEENRNVKGKENTIETPSGVKGCSDETNSETVTDSLDSIISHIEKSMLSDCNLDSFESKQNLLQITQKIRKYLYSNFIQLSYIYQKLWNQYQQFKLIKENLFLVSCSPINVVVPNDLSNDLENLVQETHNAFSQYLELNEKCQRVSEAILKKIETRLKIEKIQRNILEQHNHYFSTLEHVYSKKSHLKSSIKASEELANMIDDLKTSLRNSECRVDLHLLAIDKAVSAYTEMELFQNVLEKLFYCIKLYLCKMEF